MKRITIWLLFAILACAPQTKGVDFEITSNSETAISNVRFYTSEKLVEMKFNSISQNNDVIGFLPMDGNEGDGAFVIEFNRKDGSNEIYSDGYYTKGGALNSHIEIIIKNDSVIFQYK